MIEYSTSNPAEVINKFLCPVCQDVVYRPKMTPCEHIFCFKCIKLWLETSQTCPVCRQLIDKNGTTNPPKAFQEELLKLKVKCTFREKGCSDEIDLKSLQKHERTCKFKGPRCHSSICKRPLHQTEEADLVYPVKRMKFCCKSCLEEHVMHNYLLPIKRLKMWEELKKEYSGSCAYLFILLTTEPNMNAFCCFYFLNEITQGIAHFLSFKIWKCIDIQRVKILGLKKNSSERCR